MLNAIAPVNFSNPGERAHMFKTYASAAIAAMAFAAAGSASAAYVTFTGIDNNGSEAAQSTPVNSGAAETAFKAGLVGVGTQNFESYAVGANAAAVSPISFGAAGTATMAGNGAVAGNAPGATNGVGRYSVPGGVRFWETDAGAGTFELTFSASIAAFGFYGIDLGDFAGTLQLQLFNAANVLISTQNVPTAATNAGGSIVYFGLVAGTAAEEFRRVRFVSTVGSGDFFAFDSFTIGTREQVIPTPEPASLALVATALLGLGLSRRRRA
jgi:PEP-CTERM motif